MSTEPVKPHLQSSLGECLSVWLRNLRHWRTALAVRYLAKQLQRDYEFRHSWHANIAMSIYDARPKAVDMTGFSAQAWCTNRNCKKVMDTDLAMAFQVILEERVENERLTIEKCNVLADRLMKHLFNA